MVWRFVGLAASGLLIAAPVASFAAADNQRAGHRPTSVWTNRKSPEPAAAPAAPAAPIAPVVPAAPAPARPVVSAPASTPVSGRYAAYLSPADPKSLWLVNTATGSFARCEAEALDKPPICSPWSSPPGETAEWRFDPVAKSVVPMNDAARRGVASEPAPN